MIDERARKIAEDIFHVHQEKPAGSAASTDKSATVTPAEPTEPPHLMRPWEKTCPDCGASNPAYKKPDLFCSDCGVPVGNLPPDFKVGPGEEKELDHKPCWNCGSDKFKVKT